MKEKMTRQQKRKIDREYTKRFVKAGRKVEHSGVLDSKKGVPDIKQIEPGSFCFPSFYITEGKNENEFQSSLRSFSDVISQEYRYTPPTVMFIVIFKPHPYETDEMAERVSRTILSKSLYDNIIMFIHRDDDIKALSEEEGNKLSDEIIGTFCKENADEILENLEICFARMRGEDKDE